MLAGGRSERFGRDKLAEPVGDAPMLHHVIRALATLCDEVLVSVPSDGPAPSTPPDVGVVLVRDQRPDEGPLIGLWTSLAQVSTPLALVAGGDMPYLVPEVLSRLVQEAGEHPEALVVCLDDGGTVRPLPCVLRAEAAVRLTEITAAGERRLRALVWEFPTAVVPEGAWRTLDPEGRSLRDVDKLSDL